MSAVPPSNSGKLAGDMSSAMGVKIDEHVQFKSNIPILQGKGHNGNTVYTVLPDGTTQQQQTDQSYHPNSAEAQSGFNATMFQRHQNETITATGNMHLEENNFSGLHAPNQNTQAGGESNLPVPYNSSTNRSAPPPQIFSASLNSANLITASEKMYENPLVDGQGQRKTAHSSLHGVNQNYAHSLALGNNMHINASNNASVQTNSNHYSTATYHHAHAGSHTYSQQQNSYTQSNSYSQNSAGIQYPSSSSYQASGNEQLVSIEAQHGSGNTPTYVLLQAPSEGSETGNQPQVFLAMQTGISSQDNQSSPYITLQPVSVDGSELQAGAIGQEGMHLQPGVLGTTSELTGESSKQIGGSEQGQQVVLSIPGQQAMLQSGGSNGNNIVTYLQPLAGIGVPGANMEQNQVIMAASDLQGNLTLLGNSLASTSKRPVQQSRSSSQVGLQTPRRRLSQDPRTCDQCGRSFKYPSDLKKHLQIHTDIKKFACEECPRTFRRLHQLNVHRRIHTGEKPYACTRCGAQFRHDSTLTMHIRTRHDHLKPFNCEGCGKKFGRMSHLRKHQRNVCGRGNVRGAVTQCKYCETIFSKKADLKLHVNECIKKPDMLEKDILDSVTYICETCGKEFPRPYEFKRHQMLHNEDKPYGCPQCGKTFKERTTLNKHVKRMHCAEGDGTIPIDDVDIIGCDEDEDEVNEEGALSIVGNVTGQTTTATVTAETLAKAGIITTSDGQILTTSGQPLTPADLLNYPAIAEALGLTSGTHATVLDADGNSAMITISQHDNLETSEVSMDMEPTVLQDDTNTVGSPHYIPASEALHITPVVSVSPEELDPNHDIQAVYTSSEQNEQTIYSNESGSEDVVYRNENALDSSMVFKHENPTPTFIKTEEEDLVSDHTKAEEAAAHDLEPQTDISNHGHDDPSSITIYVDDMQGNIVSNSEAQIVEEEPLDETEKATQQLVEENSSTMTLAISDSDADMRSSNTHNQEST